MSNRYCILAVLTTLALISCAQSNRDAVKANPAVSPPQSWETVSESTPLIDANHIIRAAERPRRIQDGLIRESIDLSVGTINYWSADPASAHGEYAGDSPEAGPLTIVDRSPVDSIPVENRRPSITVMFNRPMVPLARLGEPITQTPLMSIEPAVEGVYRWYGTKTLAFRPNQSLLNASHYRITISKDAQSLSGERLGEDYVFNLYGERVKLVHLYAGRDVNNQPRAWDVPPAIARNITLEFNQFIDIPTIAESIQVKVGSRSVDFTAGAAEYPQQLAQQSKRALVLTLDKDPPESTKIRVILKKGARPQPDYPPSEKNQSLDLKTLRPFRALELEANPSRFSRDNRSTFFPVYLRFSHSVAEEIPQSGFTVSVNGQAVEPRDIETGWRSLVFSLPNIGANDTIVVRIPPGIRDIHGREARRGRFTVRVPRPRPYADHPSHRDGLRHLEAAFQPSVVWKLRNIVEGTIGLAKLPYFYNSPRQRLEKAPLDLSAMKPDITYFHEIDLTDHLASNGRGTVQLDLELRHDPLLTESEAQEWDRDRIAIQVTDLGLSIRVAHNRILVWVNRLSTGEAVPGADVTAFNLKGGEFLATTDSDGLAVLNIPPNAFTEVFSNDDYRNSTDRVHVRAEKDGDVAEIRVRENNDAWSFGVHRVENPEDAGTPVHRIHMFTDRDLYKPGEELALRGIHWLQNPEGFRSYEGTYGISISDSGTNKVIWNEKGTTTESGGFAHRFNLPDDLEPGYYTFKYRGGGANGRVRFRIAAFRAVAFQVDSTISEDPIYYGDTVEALVNASYLWGGVMPSAPYHYYWTRKPVDFTPPGPDWEGWVFGTSHWGHEQNLSSGDGRLAETGTAQIDEVSVNHEVEGRVYRYTLETTVEDIDRQAISSIASVLVHPSTHYIGARFGSGAVDGWWSRFIPVDEDVNVMTQLVGIDGNAAKLEGTLTSTLFKGEWKSVQQQGLYNRLNTRWEFLEEETWQREDALANGAADFDFSVDAPGTYRLLFEHTDANNRLTRTEIKFYATGSGWVNQASQTPSDINLLVDKALYDPGETARILVQSPIAAGRYLLTIEREGILSQRVLTLEGSNSIVEVPILEEYLPVFYVALTSYTERTETEDDYFEPDLGKPRSLFGITTVHVARTAVELEVEVKTTQDSYRPGEEAEVVVQVNDDGRPVNGAEVTILAVDRGVLDLTDYHIPNPLDYFYSESHFPHAVMGDDSRRLLIRPVTYEIANLQGGASGKSLEEDSQERRDFNPLAFFEPVVRTDKDGIARLRARLPDSLTTYRLTAVALDASRLGYGENEFLVSNPLNVRTALPRRFRNRDTAAAGVVISNSTNEDQELSVSVESDILSVAGDSEKTVLLPANTTMELPFVLEAMTEGQGVVRFTTRSDLLNEVLENPVTVERPVTMEAFATMGAADDAVDAVQEKLIFPEGRVPGHGSLTISLGTTLRPYIQPAVDRLTDIAYPAQTDKLYALTADLAAGRRVAAKAVFEELAKKQFPDGGVGYRSPALEYSRSHWFLSTLTAFTAFQIHSRQEFNNPVDEEALHSFLAMNLSEAEKKDSASFLACWTAWMLAENQLINRKDLIWLQAAEDRLGIAGYNLLARAFDALGHRSDAEKLYNRCKNFITVGTRSIDIIETYEKTSYFSTGEKELALMLMNSHHLDENQELILRMAESIQGNSRRFHSRFDDFWLINGFLPLLEPGKRAQRSTVAVDLEQVSLMETRLNSRNNPTAAQAFALDESPLSDMEDGELLDLTMTKTGSGNLYWSAVLDYALPVETAGPRDEGIEVFHQIESLDGTVLDEENLPLGQTLRMRVIVSTLERRSGLKLTVPIPSGAEIVDSSLATTGAYDDVGGTDDEKWTRETVYGEEQSFAGDGYILADRSGWYFWFYRPIRTVYDNAVTYEWEDFYSGQREISFLIRSTTPGVYPTPPVTASLEFKPEVFGRTGGRLSVIRGE